MTNGFFDLLIVKMGWFEASRRLLVGHTKNKQRNIYEHIVIYQYLVI